ncbi:MAG: hypothetical protein OEV66_07990 [Spirochaetia bacterium]|nr:hypothetical protein [Spirochaetia bacterium]
MNSLENLLDWCKNKNIIVAGGGPSLDVCEKELEYFCGADSLFILADVVAEKFILKYPETNRLIFTVENRHHRYLSNVRGERIAVYRGARERNMNISVNECFSFHFDFESNVKDSMMLKSPGTVMGAALYWALYVAIRHKRRQTVYLLGMDLCYLENQIYNRYCKFNEKRDFFNNRETREWNAMLQRTSTGIMQNNSVIKTSFEFQRARENMETLIQNTPDIQIIDFSPVGISGKFVKKSIPGKIKAEIIAT